MKTVYNLNILKKTSSKSVKKIFLAVTAIALLCLLVLLPQFSYAWVGRMDNQASSVIGQIDFNSILANQGGAANAKTVNRPRGVWEGNGRLAITDWMSHRILIYNTIPTSNNPAADVVIGQQNFSSVSSNQAGSVNANTLSQPGGISGGGGKFVVSDNANNRVLIFNGLPTENNASADVVLGQPNFTTNTYVSPTASSMSIPEDVWTNGEKVIVADRSNSRVLIWNSMPTENGQPADAVVGQQNFTSNSPNQGGNVAANTLNLPNGISSDGTKLFIADSENRRVLIYNHIPTENNESADVVIGQPDFSSTNINQGLPHPEAYTLGGDGSPQRIYSEGVRLYVCDKGNQRILVYNTIPTQNNASADAVFGQPDFVSSGITSGAGGISSPRSIFAGASQFYVTDRGYNRVLVFKLAPENISLSINNGASLTNNYNVTLNTSAIGASEMIISNNADFSEAVWEPYVTEKLWNLASTQSSSVGSVKTVYAKFRDWGAFESSVVQANISLKVDDESSDLITPVPSSTASTAIPNLSVLPKTGASSVERGNAIVRLLDWIKKLI